MPAFLSSLTTVPLTSSFGDDDAEGTPAGQGPVADSGLFWPSPSGALMCRLRIPGGLVKAAQLRALATLSHDLTTGHLQITTRGNLQLRRIAPGDAPAVMTRLRACDLHLPGDGNLRNLTMGPMAGLDPTELADVRPLVQWMRRVIAGTPEFRDLPRKLNLAFDGGGAISCIEEGNDIGASAAEILHSAPGVSPGVWYRLALGGAPRQDHAFLVHPRDLVPACAAILRLLLRETRKAGAGPLRVKHLVERIGTSGLFDALAEKDGILIARVPHRSPCLASPIQPALAHAQVGHLPQKQSGHVAVGVAVPVGRVTAAQLEAVAALADRFGSGEIRLTVWQNLLIPDVDERDFPQIARALQKAGLDAEPVPGASGVTACTGNRHCPHALSDTQGHAVAAMARLAQTPLGPTPVGVHFSGCARACARHFTGDIGLVAVPATDEDPTREHYALTVGGSTGPHARTARPVFDGVPAEEVPALLDKDARGVPGRAPAGRKLPPLLRALFRAGAAEEVRAVRRPPGGPPPDEFPDKALGA